MNYDTIIPLPQEYNRGLVHLNLFEPPSYVISNRVHPRGSHRSAIIRSIVIGVTGLPIHRYDDLFFISSSMSLSRILRRHRLTSFSFNEYYHNCT
jgi:hypothetical protein